MTSTTVRTTTLPPIRILPIPEHRPPYLDPDIPWNEFEIEAQRAALYVQDALAFEFMPRRSDAEYDTPATDLPDPEPWLRASCQAVLEVMAGLRPPAQVVRSCSPDVYLAVARRYASARRRAAAQPTQPGVDRIRRPNVVRIRVTRPDPAVVEAVVLLNVGPRVRAMAIRADAASTGWRITALELG